MNYCSLKLKKAQGLKCDLKRLKKPFSLDVRVFKENEITFKQFIYITMWAVRRDYIRKFWFMHAWLSPRSYIKLMKITKYILSSARIIMTTVWLKHDFISKRIICLKQTNHLLTCRTPAYLEAHKNGRVGGETAHGRKWNALRKTGSGGGH